MITSLIFYVIRCQNVNMVFLKIDFVFLNYFISSYAYVNEQLAKSHSVDVVYLDFRKAFDTVCHNELLYKLWRLGVTGPLWLWFKEYLSNRVHYVCLNNVNSSMLPVNLEYHKAVFWVLCCF